MISLKCNMVVFLFCCVKMVWQNQRCSQWQFAHGFHKSLHKSHISDWCQCYAVFAEETFENVLLWVLRNVLFALYICSVSSSTVQSARSSGCQSYLLSLSNRVLHCSNFCCEDSQCFFTREWTLWNQEWDRQQRKERDELCTLKI